MVHYVSQIIKPVERAGTDDKIHILFRHIVKEQYFICLWNQRIDVNLKGGQSLSQNSQWPFKNVFV